MTTETEIQRVAAMNERQLKQRIEQFERSIAARMEDLAEDARQLALLRAEQTKREAVAGVIATLGS